MRLFHIFLIVTVFCTSCKKDLVDATQNDIDDVQSLESFKSEIKEGTTVVFYFASWCSVCEEFRPTVESVQKSDDLTSVKCLEVEYDDNRDVFTDQGVNSFPQLVVYKDGLEQTRLIGKNHSEDEVRDTIKKFL